MVTRAERLEAFITDRDPPPGRLVEVLCEDHVGTYVLPFLCRRKPEGLRNERTGELIEGRVVGWRKPTEWFCSVAPVRTADDLASVIRLFRSYAASLGVDLAYQNLEAEMASMPGKYAPPKGELLLAHDLTGAPIGCVGLRPLEVPGCCEMKRLYVSPEGRGMGLGRRLVEAVVREAERIGYCEMRLDTLPFMDDAVALYTKLGFEPMEPYYETPVVGTILLRRTLQQAS